MDDDVLSWQSMLLESLVPLGLALLLGALVGWDRESQGKLAGLRTHMLVSSGAALFVLTALQMAAKTSVDGVTIDTVRIIEGVATGIGFLGAGSIVKSGNHVEGVTTAASVWVTGAVGAACGAGLYVLAGVGAVLSLLVLWPVVKLKDGAFHE